MLHNLRSNPVAKSTRSSTAVQFSRLPAIIVVVFVPRRYEIGCLRYLLRGRKKEETVVTSRSGERNELYHTAGISIGKRVPRARKPLLSPSLSLRLPRRRPVILDAPLRFRRQGTATIHGLRRVGSVGVKIFIKCVAVLTGRGDVTSPEKVG